MLDIKITQRKDLKPKPDDEQARIRQDIYRPHVHHELYRVERLARREDCSLRPLCSTRHAWSSITRRRCSRGSRPPRCRRRILLFRPQKNFERMNKTNRRICIPEVNLNDALQAVVELVRLERDWVPRRRYLALHQAFHIRTDPQLGVHPSKTYILQ